MRVIADTDVFMPSLLVKIGEAKMTKMPFQTLFNAGSRNH